MTETEWLVSVDPDEMLDFLKGKASDRKLRLTAVACSRQVEHLMTDERNRKALDDVERFADGMATKKELAAARGKQVAILHDVFGNPFLPWWVEQVPTTDAYGRRLARDPAGRTELVAALREMVHRPNVLENPWLTWRDGLVVRTAQGICESRRFEELPVLADMLSDAGCDNAELLGHLRGPGPHVRGCWAVDLLLGKE